MAIIKAVETPQGVTATYHRIAKVEIDVNDQCLVVVTAMYASPEARQTGKGALWHEYTRIPFASLTEDPRDSIYRLIELYDGSYVKGGVRDDSPPPAD